MAGGGRVDGVKNISSPVVSLRSSLSMPLVVHLTVSNGERNKYADPGSTESRDRERKREKNSDDFSFARRRTFTEPTLALSGTKLLSRHVRLFKLHLVYFAGASSRRVGETL